MTLATSLSDHVRACCSGIWIQSHEHEDAIADISRLCAEQQWHLATWDIEQGLQFSGQATEESGTASDPVAAIRSINSLATADGAALLVLTNFHRFLQSAEVIQAVAQQVTLGKRNRTFLIVLSPTVQLPLELEKLFVVLEHDLPDREQLEQIARGIATEEDELPQGEQLQQVLDSAVGLTRHEAEVAFSLSLVQHGRLTPSVLWNTKAQTLKKSGLLSLHQGGDSLDCLGGMRALKSFCIRALRRTNSEESSPQARGVLLLGVPGTGKSAFAKGLGHEVGRPTLIMDVGALMGGIVGETERNVRQALRIVDAMSPAILMIDEVEKALSGVANSGQSDSGVSARLFGTFLTWLADHQSDVFVICTCNNISALPPEFARAERFDGVFFCDLPGASHKGSIWDIYLQQYELDPEQPKPRTDQWTGAEIKSCCRLAALLDISLKEAAKHVVPVAVTASESIERLRNWANGRCLDADAPGIYARRASLSRNAARDISAN
ncbi:MAG: AAA family ATPase [Planctomycetes bacterium]|nr:AAA family ATPase [Planctomycetota bacterium]